MNKKFLLAMALPAVLVGCSQEDLVSEGVAQAPVAKAIDNVTFTIAKENPTLGGVESRADWVNNKIKFEKSDKVSLYWLGNDEMTGEPGEVEFNKDLEATALVGHSNAVFRTEDGSKFTAEAVVYEGYNLLVYPANVKHTTAKEIEVSLPEVQEASEDFAENTIYVGDSILHVHQPIEVRSGVFKDLYGQSATTEDPNTPGYAHGIKTGVKLLTSLLNMDLRIVNAPANDVVINKVVLKAKNNSALFYNSGNLVAGDNLAIANTDGAGSKALYTNPWFEGTNPVKEVVLSFDGVATRVTGSTRGTMLLLPTGYQVFDHNIVDPSQPVLEVHTNYGVVTIGGDVNENDAQTNAIYKKDGIEKAAKNDKIALLEIIKNATSYQDSSIKVYDKTATNKKQDYTINTGVSMTRVIKVDMAKAQMTGMKASTTEELNAILKAAITNPNNKFTASEPLTVELVSNRSKQFILTNYDGLDKFVAKFGKGALSLIPDTKDETVVMNTTSVTELKNVEGLDPNFTLTIPATSKINTIKKGTSSAPTVIAHKIDNQKTITLPQYSTIAIKDNSKGELIYAGGAISNTPDLDNTTYGVIRYEATTKKKMEEAAKAGVNYIKLKNLPEAFFDGYVDMENYDYPAYQKTGITVEFDNCGDLAKTAENGIFTHAIVLTNGTYYSDMDKAKVENVIVKSSTAKLGSNAEAVKEIKGTITIENGTTEINNIKVTNLEVKKGATANLGSKSVAPTNLTVWGTASFAGDNQVGKVFDTDDYGRIDVVNAIDGVCIVTGSLQLKKDLAYTKVAVSGTTNITVAASVKGLGYNRAINVTKAGQETGTANLFTYQDGTKTTRFSWDGLNVSTLQW